MSAARSRQPDAVLLSVGWGALWGIALGLWLLAPAILETHHLRPETAGQSAVLLGVLTLIFGALGAILGFAGGFTLLVVETLAGPFRARASAYALFIAIPLAIAYVAESLWIHWMTYRSFRFAPAAYQGLAVFGISCAIALVALVALYRAIVNRGARIRPATLGLALSALAAAGAVALVARTPAALAPANNGPLERLPEATDDVPLLLIGLDGGSWRLLAPAIESGLAPTLQRLVDRGVTGTVDALWPPYWSGAAWGAILTGLPRETTGVYEDLAATAPGLPLFQAGLQSRLQLNPIHAVRSILLAYDVISFTPPPRPLLKAKPIWQLLHEAGVQTAVVRFRFTYPPRGQADIVVSDWVGRDQWEGLRVERRPEVTPVAPEERAEQLMAPFDAEGVSDPNLFTRLLPGPRPDKPPDVVLDPIRELETASDIDERTFDVSESIVGAHPNLSFLAIYIGGLDSVQHAFWQYRFPGDFPGAEPAHSDIERLGRVPDEYVRYFDERLNRLLARYAREPNVIIVSDHGFGPTTVASGWRGWHAQEGIFIAAGPSVRHVRNSVEVSYYDMVPTIARLKGFRAPDSLRGRPVVSDVNDTESGPLPHVP